MDIINYHCRIICGDARLSLCSAWNEVNKLKEGFSARIEIELDCGNTVFTTAEQVAVKYELERLFNAKGMLCTDINMYG